DRVVIVGHSATSEPQKTLSKSRATAVRNELVKRGVEAHRLQTQGAGSSERLAGDDTAEAHALNRRVELWVSPGAPVARLTWMQREVELREPLGTAWSKAEPRAALRRYVELRTAGDSAAEVTVEAGPPSKLSLGPASLA